jgi:hypothetical protein
MDALRCVDGSRLAARPVPAPEPGRAAWPAQIALELTRDDEPFALVAARCGPSLTRLAARLAAARQDPEQAVGWPDPDDRFPGLAGAPGPLGGFAAAGPELFVLRSWPAPSGPGWPASGEPAEWPGGGELRVVLRSAAARFPATAGPEGPSFLEKTGGSQDLAVSEDTAVSATVAGWRLSRRAIVEAWGEPGIGVRAVLTSAELATFLDTVLSEPVTGTRTKQGAGRAERAGRWLGGFRAPRWRQRGRTPDGTARSGLPAVRTQA